MAQLLFSNFNNTTLAGAITNTSLSLAVAAGSGTLYASPTTGQYFTAVLMDAATKQTKEIIQVTGRSGDTFTIVRGQQGTTAAAYNAGDILFCGITAGDMAQFLQIGVDPPDNFAVASGTNTYTIAWNLTQTSYAQGNPQGLVYFTNANTSATCTLNDGTGAKTLLRADGLPPAVASGTSGADVSGYCFVFYDGSAWRFANLLTIGDVLALIPPVVQQIVPTIARPQAKANQTFYVATTGSDSNPGTQASPFLTPGRAVQAAQGYDYAGLYSATIQFASGTYSGAGIGVSGGLVGCPTQLNFIGSPTTPANVVLNTTAPLSGASGNPHCFNTVNGASINLNGFTLQSQNANALYAQGTGSIIGWQNCIFGACPSGQHMSAVLGGEVIIGASNVYTVSGAAQAHLYTDGSGSNIVNNGGALNVTVSGTPAFSIAFAASYNFSNMKLPNVTYGGSATGPRYNSSSSLINTYGGGANYFPGSTAGVSGQANYA